MMDAMTPFAMRAMAAAMTVLTIDNARSAEALDAWNYVRVLRPDDGLA